MLPHTNRNKIISILGALSLFLSIVEYIIPKPIPFMRLGLANLPILLSLLLLTPKETLLLIFIKSVGSSLVTGTILSWVFIYSLSGSFASGITMLIIYWIFKNKITMIGLSVAGALTSNLTQIYFATLLLGTGAKFIGLPLLIAGLASGILIGHFTNQFINQSLWVRSLK